MTHVASSENLFNKEQFQCNSTIWVIQLVLPHVVLYDDVEKTSSYLFSRESRLFRRVKIFWTLFMELENKHKKGVVRSRTRLFMIQCTIPQTISPQNVDVKDTIIYEKFASPSLEQYFPNTKRVDRSSNNDLNVQYLIYRISAHHNSKLQDISKTKISDQSDGPSCPQ